jgi:hypothetical protein
MDPLTLLKELFGDDAIRKVATSGFDSAEKIAAASPESLSFFAGIHEALARQIVATAEQSLAPPRATYRGALAGTAEAGPGEEAPRPTRPRTLAKPPAASEPDPDERPDRRPAALDERTLLDAGGVVRTVGTRGKGEKVSDLEEDLLEEVGLTGAETSFLEGISPWPSDAPRRERMTPVNPLRREPDPQERSTDPEIIEYAPISDWSPEEDPDPVPRIVLARELQDEAARETEPPGTREERHAVSEISDPVRPAGVEPLRAFWVRPGPGAETGAPAEPETAVSKPKGEEPAPPAGSSFWKFGE